MIRHLLTVLPLSAVFLAAAARAESSRQAHLTSDRPVYFTGEPIDVTFYVDAKDREVTPSFSIRDTQGNLVAEKRVNGQLLGESIGFDLDGIERRGAIPGRRHAETIPDLSIWYAIDDPGKYEITFEGYFINHDGVLETVTSNTLLIAVTSREHAAQPNDAKRDFQSIALEDIWALDMPDTRPMDRRRGIMGQYNAPEGRLLDEILRSIGSVESLKSKARPAFAVSGDGMTALTAAHEILVNGRAPRTVFRLHEPITLVFFSKYYGAYVHLESVQEWDSIIQINYQLVPHRTAEVTAHVALIPIAPQRPMRMHVEVKMQRPAPNVLSTWPVEIERVVCRSFEFEIVD